MTDSGSADRRSLAEEASELVEALKAWGADPAVRAQLATAARALLEAGAALLDTVAERQRARQDARQDPPEDPPDAPPPDPRD